MKTDFSIRLCIREILISPGDLLFALVLISSSPLLWLKFCSWCHRHLNIFCVPLSYTHSLFLSLSLSLSHAYTYTLSVSINWLGISFISSGLCAFFSFIMKTLYYCVLNPCSSRLSIFWLNPKSKTYVCLRIFDLYIHTNIEFVKMTIFTSLSKLLTGIRISVCFLLDQSSFCQWDLEYADSIPFRGVRDVSWVCHQTALDGEIPVFEIW